MAWAVQSLFSFSPVIVIYMKKFTLNRTLHTEMISKENTKPNTTPTAVDFRVILREQDGGIRRMSPSCSRKRTEKIWVLKRIVVLWFINLMTATKSAIYGKGVEDVFFD